VIEPGLALGDVTAPRRSGRFAGAGGSQLLITLDQLVFSAVSFAVLEAVAATTADTGFGVFRFVAQIQTAQWYLGRAVASEPTLVSQAAARNDTERLRAAAATAFGLGLLISLGSVIAALATSGPVRSLLLVQALAAPFLAVFDQARYVSYGSRRPLLALGLDATWLVLFCLIAVGLVGTVGLGMVSAYLTWALTGVAVTVVAAALTGSPLRLDRVWWWLTDQRRLIPGFLVDGAYLAAGMFATYAVVAWAAGIAQFGLFGKALIPITALTVLFVGIGNALLAHLAGRSPEEAIRAPLLVSALAAGACALTALVVWAVPSSIMRGLLHTDWSAVRPVVLILLVYVFGLATGQAAITAAKATGRAWVGARVRTVELCCELAFVALLGSRYGAAGAAAGMAAAWAVGATVAWTGLARHARRASNGARVRSEES
jgi:O-antigen/teichoic acid export membrane protein